MPGPSSSSSLAAIDYGQILKYELVRDLGSGNFGVAKLMRLKKGGELVAVKFIERGSRVGAAGARASEGSMSAWGGVLGLPN